MAYIMWYAIAGKVGCLKDRDLEPQQPDRSRDDADDLLAVQETLRGRKRAFDSIVERYTPLLYSLAYRMLEEREEAEEAVQEILFKAYRSLQRFRLHRRFHPWIYTIALNHLRSCLRKRQRRSRLKIVPFKEESSQGMASAGAHDPEELAEQAEGQLLVAKAISGLRPVYREVFLLRQVEGMSVRDVAEILDLPEGTVKTSLHRARKHLVDFLAEKGWE